MAEGGAGSITPPANFAVVEATATPPPKTTALVSQSPAADDTGESAIGDGDFSFLDNDPGESFVCSKCDEECPKKYICTGGKTSQACRACTGNYKAFKRITTPSSSKRNLARYFRLVSLGPCLFAPSRSISAWLFHMRDTSPSKFNKLFW